MSIDEYKAKYGAEFLKHESEGWFINFISLLKSEHLLYKFRGSVGDNLLLQGAPIYLNQIFGYDKCLDVIEKVRAVDKQRTEEPPDTYQPET